MSSRALRKALKKKQEQEVEEEPIEEVEEVESSAIGKKKQNLFALLNETDEDESSESEDSSTDSSTESSSPKPVISIQNKKLLKKNSQPVSEEEEDLDALMAQYGNAENATTATNESTNQDPLCNALKLNPDWLDSSVELKKKFGGAVVGSGASAMTQINSRLLRANPHLAKSLKRKPFKRKHGFITPRPLWPPFGPAETDLSVKRHPDGSFEIVEEQAYKDLIQELLVMIQSGDLEFLMQLIQTCPLFVDGLLLLSDAYRMQSTGDAGEIVERAVYILERVLPGEADFVQGNVRFPYCHAGNRKLHLSLFRLCQFTIKKGCWRVSLQIAKALLQLDPVNDPLAARLFIEFLALQAGDLAEFDLLYEELKKTCVIPLLPSWPFSRALRMYLEEEQNKSDHSVSSEFLIEAIKQNTSTAKQLAAHLKVTWPDSLAAAEEDAFSAAASKIFVARCGMLWKGSAEGWFKAALSKVNSVAITITSSAPLSAQVAVYRHALLSDLPGLSVAFPPALSMHLNSFDPCPPEFFEDGGAEGGLLGSLISRIRSMMA